MTIKRHCQACGRTEPIADATIRECSFEVVGWAGRRNDADLCPRCRASLLARYFGVEPGVQSAEEIERAALTGPPEMPRFLEPELEPEVADADYAGSL